MSDDTRGFGPDDNGDDPGRSAESDAPLRRVLAGRYDVLDEIGSGATATTWRGRDRRLNRLVAIKIMRRDHELDTSFAKRFEREARTAAAVSHGNVVDVYDVGQDEGDLFIVMQYIDGEDLKHLIGREGPLPARRAREIVRQVLAGVGAIHASGIVHRDIKPQNVLIGRDGIARVTDFGIAQDAMDVGLTTAGTTVGTAAYMAPEQAQGGQVTEATDLYAVGVMLYEMLTGEMPFAAATPMGMMLAHIQQRPEPPSAHAAEGTVPATLDGIVLQAMAKDPGDRFRTASAMSRALEGVTTTSRSTTVLPVARRDQRTRAPGVPARTETEDRPVRLAAADAGRAGSGLRGVLGGFLLLLMLAIAGVGGYFIYDMVMAEGNGDEPAAEEVTSQATETGSTATATSAVSGVPAEDPTELPAIVATETIEPAVPTPTRIPTQIPTAVPTQAPTAVPTDVPTAEPTEEPTEAPTDAPIEPEPTTDPIQIIEPVDRQDGADNDNSDGDEDGNGGEQGAVIDQNTGVAGNSRQSTGSAGSQSRVTGAGQGEGAVAGQATTLEIEPKSWKGDGSKHDKDQGWVVVAPGTSATATFTIGSVPAGESFEIEIELAVTGSGKTPLTVFLNGQELGEFDESLPLLPEGGGSRDLGTLRITLPTAPLDDGKNEITIVNGAKANGSRGEDGDDASGTKRRDLPDNALLLAASIVTIDLAE